MLLQRERGFNRNTCIWYVEVWDLKLYIYPSAVRWKKYTREYKKEGRGGILGWWTWGFMSPTPQSAWDVPQKPKTCGQKTLFDFSVELERNVTSWEICRKILTTCLLYVPILLIDGSVRKNLAHGTRKNKFNHLERHFQTSATKSRWLEDTISFSTSLIWAPNAF